jgi:antitoxin component YwqK of YwqJK toxin-antitoxin module
MEWLKYLVIEHNANGILVNSWKQGIHQEFNTREYTYIRTYFDNLLHGDEWVYLDDNTLRRHYYYINGLRHGLQYEYHYESYAIREKSSYKFGKLHGARVLYGTNGVIIEEAHYAYDKLNGTKKLWSAYNGQLEFEGQYINDKLHGKQKSYTIFSNEFIYGVNEQTFNEYLLNIRDAGCKINMKTLKLERQRTR